MSFMLLLSTILMATRLSLDPLVSADISLSKNPLIYFYELPLCLLCYAKYVCSDSDLLLSSLAHRDLAT